jgi:two-component system phosphate regulon sensor histidine kinase PhoR
MTTKGEQGNGMGLWTVKHILNKHHGGITVQSERGEGTRLNLWWPRAFASTPQ